MLQSGGSQTILTTHGLLDLFIDCHTPQGDTERIKGDIGQLFCHLKWRERVRGMLLQDTKDIGTESAQLTLHRMSSILGRIGAGPVPGDREIVCIRRISGRIKGGISGGISAREAETERGGQWADI